MLLGTPYIYGLHDWADDAAPVLSRPSWIVVSEGVGHDPASAWGRDYSPIAAKGHVPIIRLNNGYFPDGTVPQPERYQDFAARLARFVAASRGCSLWIVGNEPNHSQERPQGRPITPDDYARCFRLCRDAIRAVPGHGADGVIPAAVAPWNVETGDWLDYFERVLALLAPTGLDGIALHTYTHGADPALVTSNATMDPPYATRHYHFRAYRDFLYRVPLVLRGLPVYVTEADQDDPWRDANSGWVRAAYREIDSWNRAGGQTIRCLCLYRWAGDRWAIRGKGGVNADFRAAQDEGLRWNGAAGDGGEGESSGDGDDQQEGNGGGDLNEIELALLNPGFEGAFTERGAGEVKIAEGWEGWWHSGDARPEYKAAVLSVDPRRVRGGQKAQQWFNVYHTHTAGVFQRVRDVPAGELVFSAWVQCWSTNDNDPSKSTGRYRMRIGIDPYGGVDAEGKDVVWCQAIQPYDAWHRLEVRTPARSDRCTVFVWGQAEWAVHHNDAYVDDCRLVCLAEGGAGPSPSPEPSPPGDLDSLKLWAIDLMMCLFAKAYDAALVALEKEREAMGAALEAEGDDDDLEVPGWSLAGWFRGLIARAGWPKRE